MELGTKDYLIRNLTKHYTEEQKAIEAGYQIYDAMPISFIFDTKMEQLESFKNCFDDHKLTRMDQKHCEKNVWIVKPC